jgi:transmembrane sensor
MRRSRWPDEASDAGTRTLQRALDEARPHVRSEARQQRVWQALQARAKRGETGARRSRWWLTGALALGACAAAVVMVARVTWPPPQGAAAPASAEVLATGTGETLARTLAGGTEVRLGGESVLALPAGSAPVVRAGRADFHVPRQAPGHRFAVRAGDVEVRVVGTRFEVARVGARVNVAVSEGVVEVWAPSPSTRALTLAARLRAGESFSHPPEAPASVAPGRGPAELAAPGPPFQRRAPAPRAPSAQAALVDAGASSLVEARVARSTDAAQALVLYRRLAAGTGPSAENALYELGEIYRDRLQEPRRALRAWQEYRTRFPAGLLRAEVDVSLIETLAQVGERARALAEATAFLGRYPSSERRHEVARVAGDLSRSSGDCRAAITFYEQAIEGLGEGRDADDVAFARAVCLLKLHDPRAEAAVRAYLVRFPAGRHASAMRAVVAGEPRR